jgi:hypothetical protein
MSPEEFTRKCFARDDANWSFKYPDNRRLPLRGTIPDQQMRHPDVFDVNREPCLLVMKSGNTTGTTLGRANGVFSIVREYYPRDMNINQTSMEWTIFGYDRKSGAFSEPGDSGSIIADIKGRIGGMLTGGSGKTEALDITYATPFEWLFKRIKAAFPNAHHQ